MMTAEMSVKLKQLLIKHEGYRNFIYQDTMGNSTVGIGYNIGARGLPDSFINEQYDNDVSYFYESLMQDYAWFKHLNEARQMALIDFCFMGYKKFKTFRRMIAALEAGNYELASYELLDSRYAMQVGKRADELASIIRTGIMV